MARNARELAAESYVSTHWGDPGEWRDRNLRCADPAEVYYAVMGRLHAITYETQKGRYGRLDLWEHEFKRPSPVLCYSPKSKLLLIAGGGYTVTARGIEG